MSSILSIIIEININYKRNFYSIFNFIFKCLILGIIVKKSKNELIVFINSISGAEPLNNAKLEIGKLGSKKTCAGPEPRACGYHPVRVANPAERD